MKLKIIDPHNIQNNKDYLSWGDFIKYKNDNVLLTNAMRGLREIDVLKPSKDFFFAGWHWKWWMFENNENLTNTLEIE